MVGAFVSAIALAAVVACGSSSSSSAGGGTGGGGSAGSTSISGSCKAPADQCSLVTTAQAATALDATMTTTMPGLMGPGDTSIGQAASGDCGYTDAANDVLVVTYLCGINDQQVSVYETVFKSQVGAGVDVDVPGLGDAAVWGGSATSLGSDSGSFASGTLAIVSGGAYVSIELTGTGTSADLEARAVAVGKIVLAGL